MYTTPTGLKFGQLSKHGVQCIGVVQHDRSITHTTPSGLKFGQLSKHGEQFIRVVWHR